MCECNSSESFFTIIGNIFICVGVLVAIWQIKADHNRRKKQSTIEFYNQISYESRDYIDILKKARRDGTQINYEDVDAVKNKELYDSVTWYLSRLERLAVGVANGTFDFDTLNSMSGAYLIIVYNQLKIYIKEVRERGSNPKRYEEFEILVKKIKKYRERYPDKTVSR